MSNIYIQEPPTNGKVLLKTTVGDIDIELWSKETPKASRNFVQLCLEGYYDGTIFHRVIPNFIAQGGDPDGTGEGGESIYGHPFKDEFHSRLRFVRRGLVAMANSVANDNGSQFFFTLGSTPELTQKHSIFGKVTGNTIYNMLKLQEVNIGANDRPYCPAKILSTEVLSNPYEDIVPRQLKRQKKEKTEEKKNKSQSKATKNFNLLSFGEEAEEDEVEVNKATKDMRGKSKSSHDLTDDPKLSATPAIDHEEEAKENEDPAKSNSAASEGESGGEEKSTLDVPPAPKKSKMSSEDGSGGGGVVVGAAAAATTAAAEVVVGATAAQEGEEGGGTHHQHQHQQRPLKSSKDPSAAVAVDSQKVTPAAPAMEKKLTRSEELRLESEKLKKEIKDMKYPKMVVEANEEKDHTDPGTKSEVVAEFRKEREKYKELKYQQGKNGPNREDITLELLSKFQSRLRAAQTVSGGYSDDSDDADGDNAGPTDATAAVAADGTVTAAAGDGSGGGKEARGGRGGGGADTTVDDGDLDDVNDMSWLRHKLHFLEPDLKVLDANVHDVDRYELFDPRNPITKRRREASKVAMAAKK